jgi:phage terminase small subunit
MSGQERAFIDRYAKTGDGVYAAKEAGYRYPAQAAHQNLAKPAVRAAIAKKNDEVLQNELVPMALACLADVLAEKNQEKYQVNARLKAADTVLKHARAANETGDAKELHEMSFDELQTAILAGNARLAALQAEQHVIEHEPEAPAEAPNLDIFA